MLQDMSDMQDDLSDVYRTTVINIKGNKDFKLFCCVWSNDNSIIIYDTTVIHI